MEAMQTATMASGGVAAPVPAPAPAPVAMQPVQMSAPTYSGGGIIDKLKGLNWVEVGFGILGSAALYYTIYYYKFSIAMKKTNISEIMNRIDGLEIRLSDIEQEGNKTPTQSATGGFLF